MLSWVCISHCVSSVSVLSLFVYLCLVSIRLSLSTCLSTCVVWSSIEICIPRRRARLLDVFHCPPNAERRWFLVSPRLACAVCSVCGVFGTGFIITYSWLEEHDLYGRYIEVTRPYNFTLSTYRFLFNPLRKVFLWPVIYAAVLFRSFFREQRERERLIFCTRGCWKCFLADKRECDEYFGNAADAVVLGS